MFLTSALSKSYDSGHNKTNEVFSVLIDGGPGWLGHKRPFPLTSVHTI